MISSLRLQNFKCFADQSITLSPLTLLSGLNGTGKSSSLQSLLLLRQSYQQGVLPSQGLALNGDFVRIGTAQDALFEGALKSEICFELNWQSGEEATWKFAYNMESDVIKLTSTSGTEGVFRENLFTDNFHYLQAERIGPRVSFEMSDYLVREHFQLGTRGEYTAHFLSTFGNNQMSNQALAHPSATSRQLRSQVEAWLSEISPGTRLSLESHVGMDVVSLRFSFALGKVESIPYRSTNVGFGITYTLPILTALLSAPQGQLILLENPEAHLHPKGQARIGELIALAAAGGVQILLETHSDHVLNGIRLAVHSGKINPEEVSLHYFKKIEKDGQVQSEVISPKIDRNGRIDKWPDGFFDEWDKSLDALLVPGGNI
ncbi:MAG: DUF3696 domain-containing protein [Acidobacteria bacterium]|nr:DUF3696 domain-containing protein [Acidobacteriota bacterium]